MVAESAATTAVIATMDMTFAHYSRCWPYSRGVIDLYKPCCGHFGRYFRLLQGLQGLRASLHVPFPCAALLTPPSPGGLCREGRCLHPCWGWGQPSQLPAVGGGSGSNPEPTEKSCGASQTLMILVVSDGDMLIQPRGSYLWPESSHLLLSP